MSTHTIPKHVAIIPDGNRRWAKEHGLRSLQGHLKGYERAIEIGEYAIERGVHYLTLWGFSTENWKRSKFEVNYLMQLLYDMINKDTDRLHEKGIRFKVIGTESRLSSRIKAAIHAAEKKTAHNTRGVFQLAFNYGGRQELIEMVKRVIHDRVAASAVNESTITERLYTVDVPDPDLIIRTSGEMRLSGYLPWQGVYSELYFAEKHWPAFTKAEFDKALTEYAKRKRRFGK